MNSLACQINCAGERLRLMYKMYLHPLTKGNKGNYITEPNWAIFCPQVTGKICKQFVQ